MKRGSLLPFLQLHIREDQLVPLTGVNFQAVQVSVLTWAVLRLRYVESTHGAHPLVYPTIQPSFVM